MEAGLPYFLRPAQEMAGGKRGKNKISRNVAEIAENLYLTRSGVSDESGVQEDGQKFPNADLDHQRHRHVIAEPWNGLDVQSVVLPCAVDATRSDEPVQGEGTMILASEKLGAERGSHQALENKIVTEVAVLHEFADDNSDVGETVVLSVSIMSPPMERLVRHAHGETPGCRTLEEKVQSQPMVEPCRAVVPTNEAQNQRVAEARHAAASPDCSLPLELTSEPYQNSYEFSTGGDVRIVLAGRGLDSNALRGWCSWARVVLPQLGAASQEMGTCVVPARAGLYIDLSQNSIDDSGVEALVDLLTDGLPGARVRALWLHKNRLGPAAGQRLALLLRLLGAWPHKWYAALEELHLSHNALGRDGLIPILEAIAQSRTSDCLPTYPLVDIACSGRRSWRPLWLRVERNGHGDTTQFLNEMNRELARFRRSAGRSTAAILCPADRSYGCNSRRCLHQRGEEGPIAHIACFHTPRTPVRERSRPLRVPSRHARDWESWEWKTWAGAHQDWQHAGLASDSSSRSWGPRRARSCGPRSSFTHTAGTRVSSVISDRWSPAGAPLTVCDDAAPSENPSFGDCERASVTCSPESAELPLTSLAFTFV